MATTAAGARLTESHRQAQVRLNALTVTEMRRIWRLIDPDNLEDTAQPWVEAALRIIAARHTVSATLGRRYYRSFRAAEVGAAPPGALGRPAFNAEAASSSLFATGPAVIERARRRGQDVARATRIAEASSAVAAGRHALLGGRETVLGAIRDDRRALGYARATSGNSCAFCALLAGRGAVYSSEDVASFQAHDSCSCMAEPVYTRDAPLPQGSDRYAELYREKAQGAEDPLNAFRRAYEGRDE